MKTKLSLAAGCLILALLVGCAALPYKKTVPLEERVNGYMQAQVDKKWNLAYSFFDSTSKKQIARENYVNRNRKLSFTGYRVEDISVDPSGDRATVKVRIDLFFMGYEFKGDHGGPQTQTWVKQKGSWFVIAPNTLTGSSNPFANPDDNK